MNFNILTPVPPRVDKRNVKQVLKLWMRIYRMNEARGHRLTFFFAMPQQTTAVHPLNKFKAPKRYIQIPDLKKGEVYKSRFVELAIYRNVLLDAIKEVDQDYAVFLDLDVIPPPDFTKRFIEDGKDVCGGIIVTLAGDGKPVLGFGNFKVPYFSGVKWAEKIPKERLTEVGFVNTGCLCLSRKVIEDEKVLFPLDYVAVKDKNTVQQLSISEDHAYCHRAAEQGYKVYLDSFVRCIHARGNQVLGVPPLKIPPFKESSETPENVSIVG